MCACTPVCLSVCLSVCSTCALTLDPLTELVQAVHGAGLTQLHWGLVALQGGGRTEGLLQG